MRIANMTRLTTALVLGLTLALFMAWAAYAAGWFDTFDSYATGSQMHGQGGWTGWAGDPNAGALVKSTYARSSPNSVEITGGSDLVHTYTNYISGTWTYSAWQYVPVGFSGRSYFILMTTYLSRWSTEVYFDSASGKVHNDFGGEELPLITGRWVKLQVDIDLDADQQRFFYDGQLLYQISWSRGSGVKTIDAVDLFANGASPVYYDDISLSPAPTFAKSVDLATARSNDALHYTVVVTNSEALSPHMGDVITDALPLNTSYVTGPTCNFGVCGYNSGTQVITWTGNIPAADILRLDYTVLVNPGVANGTIITNTASTHVGRINGTTNQVTTTVYNPAFTLTKQTEGTLVAGVPFTYTIAVSNTSAQAASEGVVVNDTLPTGASHVSGGILQGNVVSWTIPTIPANSQAQVSFVVSTCQTSLVNNTYQVATSTQHVASALGPVLTSSPVAPTLVAGFAHNPSINIVMSQTVNFTDTSAANGSPIVAWAWNFGDTNTATGATANHIYAAPGSYTATLSITDACGYADTVEVPIIVFSTITVNKVGNGTVTLDPSPGPYPLNQVVTLTATADPGWTFAGWGGACSGESACTLTMNSNKTVDATFTRNEYTLDVLKVGSGSVAWNPDKAKYYYGDVVTLTATANVLWTFDRWSGDVNSTTNPLVITMDGNKNITATFKQYLIYLPFITKSN